jgi:hypothetical protein
MTKLFWILYPFTTAAVAVNLFMLTLAWQRIGLPVFSPVMALLVSMPIGIPVNIAATNWVRRLLDESEE